MMRNVLAALVAGFLILAWQTASHTFLELHAEQEKYTPNHAGILKMLGDSLGAEGQYFLPGAPPGTTMEEMEKISAAGKGKPWAQISYHRSMDMDMTANLLRGLGTNVIVAFVLVWLLGKMKNLTFANAFMACLAVGFVAFCVHPYPTYIWYKTPGIKMELLDSLVSFGLAGIWLGWFLPKKA